MELIGRGRDADVYALGDGRVLRRYRPGGPAGAEAEARLMAYLAGQGFPVPHVYDAHGTDQVPERLGARPCGPTPAPGYAHALAARLADRNLTPGEARRLRHALDAGARRPGPGWGGHRVGG